MHVWGCFPVIGRCELRGRDHRYRQTEDIEHIDMFCLTELCVTPDCLTEPIWVMC